MASSPESEFDSKLIDWHLGRLSEPERLELERRIQTDPELKTHSEALAAMFQALDSVREPDPKLPTQMIQRIAARARAAGPPPRLLHPQRNLAAVADQFESPPAIRMHNFREIAAVAAIIVVAVGFAVPGLLHMRERGQRARCSANLAQIGRGLQAYALASHGSLPFAGWSRNNSWRPTDEPGLDVLPNHRHVYPLLRNGHLPALVFVCPSAKDQPMSDAQVPFHNDFLESRNVSYAYQNMAGVRPSLRDKPDLPVFGDDNPFFDNGWPLFAVARSLGLSDPAQTNSRTHGGAGQNILTIDGHVRWMTTPNAGVDGDNIWTLNGVGEYTGREGPQSSTDSHLLK